MAHVRGERESLNAQSAERDARGPRIEVLYHTPKTLEAGAMETPISK